MTALGDLLTPGTAGCLTHFDVTEIFMAGADKGAPVRNVFTILVAEARDGDPLSEPSFLGERIS